jgi:CheY-like chemotaxis protein
MNDPSAPTANSVRKTLAAARILILDDEPTMRSVIASTLRAAGCEDVSQAGNGQEALETIIRKRIELVVCDWMMTPMNGLQFLQALRATPHGAQLPAIMLTANSDPADAQRAQSLNVSGWLVKPISPPRLIERVCSVLSLPDQAFSLEADLGVDFSIVAEQFRARLGQQLNDLNQLIASLPHQVGHVSGTWINIIRIFHFVKGQAGMFDYGLVTAIAELGQHLLRAIERDFDAAPKIHHQLQRPLCALATAMSLVLESDLRGDGGAVGQRLLDKLRSVSEPVRLALEEATRAARHS